MCSDMMGPHMTLYNTVVTEERLKEVPTPGYSPVTMQCASLQ